MSLESHIKNVFQVYRPKRGWKTIYWMVDVHGVIIPGSWHRENDFQFISKIAPIVLKWISDREDQRLILWTSSYSKEVEKIRDWLFSQGIVVDYVNVNPVEKNTAYADFTYKPYFNILLDDKSGMMPEYDWILVAKAIENSTGDKIIEWNDFNKNLLLDVVEKKKSELSDFVAF